MSASGYHDRQKAAARAARNCPGYGRRINAWPGEDVCPVCGAWVRVRQDSTVGAHKPRKGAKA